MAFMEPDLSVGYDEVPWYRKTWFLIVLLFIFWPVTLIITLTGDYYQKANRRHRKRSSAEVWRSTGSGRAVAVMSAVLVGVLAVTQYWGPYNDQQSSRPRTDSASATVEREEVTATTELVTTTTTIPDSDGLPEFAAELQAIGTAGFASQDPTEAIALLSDRFGVLPTAGQVRIRGFLVNTADHTEGEVMHRARVSYSTDLGVAAAADVYRSETLLDIPLTGEEASTNEIGEEIELEYQGSVIDHPDPAVGFASSTVTIEDTEDGVVVTIFSSIRFDDEPLQAGALQARLAELLPLTEGYENDASGISFLTIEPFADAPTFSLNVETTSIQPLASTDDQGEAARFADDAVAAGLWVPRDISDSGIVFLERLDGFGGDLAISAHRSDEANIVRMSIRIS